ncbi:unnamed protein product [Lupinus luteus]|uniref:Uncharacterized protein n=1 Tax=Lupinus luteus TaxID=3873 RepID=A0AAV1W1M5_LUPLU
MTLESHPSKTTWISRGSSLILQRRGLEKEKSTCFKLQEHPTERIILCANSFYESTITSFIRAKGELIEDQMSATYDAKVAVDGPKYCAEAFTAANIAAYK